MQHMRRPGEARNLIAEVRSISIITEGTTNANMRDGLEH
jgi:hypothetical protein